MGVRFRNATPGTLACLAATILLAVVSFNTPLLKSLNFLSASYSSGSYSGELTLGTLGFCHTLDGSQNCTGPQVGYEFDPNDVFGVTIFDIPEAITKYLTYVLILHIVGLAFAAIATIIGIFAHSPTFPLLCLSIWMAGIASTFTFLALVFDLAMFYIARARINNVSGASAEIGICVWLTLAAWVILALSGCFFGIGNCCGSCRANSESGDSKRSKNDKYGGGEEDYKMRMMAIDNERQRKQKQEQGLPSFQTLVQDDGEDKYLIERDPQPSQQAPGGLRRDGSVLQGVGMGYGRRTNKSPSNDPYFTGNGNGWNQNSYQNIAAPPPVARRLSDTTTAGDFVGVGAGGAGVDRPQPQGYGNGYYGENPYGNGNGSDQGHGYGNGQDQQYQNDPYQQHNYNDPYSRSQQTPYQNNQYADQQYNHQDPYGQQQQQQQQYSDPYRSSSTQPYNNTSYPPVAVPAPISMPTPGIQSARSPQPQPQIGNYDTSFGSSDSHYVDPGPQVHNANTSDPYGGYNDDDGLGAIGMAVTQNGNTTRHERDYTGQTFGGYDDSQFQPSTTNNGGIHQPQPQHLAGSNSQNNLLRSPGGYDDDQPEGSSIRPPSYSAGDYSGANAGAGGSGNEKSSYRHY
ncbi:hypothetical protein L486_04883 [Kwoniella mangroviensis CBS 10435]|uniref:Pali-domain-containing protein n=1 Tax=Kwoniella mangroviensis CBS 10435 TaxID=1331196 RepID=A0A1B9IPB4_9TREE|nr:hypothetical protein L486_04883 [Kwoniella mangroviensis CBS 10435]OCF76020.1 hypothetical protein I204_03317 [Kwoniella mangroviensis CBS 8886]